MKPLTYILLIFFIFAFSLAGFYTYTSLTHPLKYRQEIIFYAEKNKLDSALVASIINVESSFNKNAKSNKNAIGLMQIKLETANYLNSLNKAPILEENDLYNVNTNIDYGTQYFRYLINKFNDINSSLAAYNAGETRVRSWLKNKEYSLDGNTLTYIPYLETRNYINKISNNYKYYKKLF